MPEFIPWVLGSHCVTYIYITCIYIYYIFFWLGLFLIQSYKMVANPSPKVRHISVLENGMEGQGGHVHVWRPQGHSMEVPWERSSAMAAPGEQVARCISKTYSFQEIWLHEAR